MNGFDFTQTGKFPVTQENLDFMQKSLSETSEWLGLFEGVQMPVILSGVDPIAIPPYGYTDGWLIVDGEILKFIGGVGNYFEINEQRENVIFEGGQPKDVKITRWAEAVTGSGTPISGLWRFHDLLSARALASTKWEEYQIPSTGTPQISGTLYMRINKMSRQLHIRGSLTVANAQSVPIPSLYYSLLDDIAEQYVPAFTVPLNFYVRYHSAAQIRDHNGSNMIILLGELTASGGLNFAPIRPESGVTAYTVHINQVISLL